MRRLPNLPPGPVPPSESAPGPKPAHFASGLVSWRSPTRIENEDQPVAVGGNSGILRASSPPPSAGAGRSSVLPVPKTSVTASTTSATMQPADGMAPGARERPVAAAAASSSLSAPASTMIHFVLRVGNVAGSPNRTRRSTTDTTSPR